MIYRIIDVAAAERPDTLRRKMQHVAQADDDRAVIDLEVPLAARGDRAAARTPGVSPGHSSLEVYLRGMTGAEAEMATVAAVDAAVLAEQPFLRIIHGMGMGVVRERVRRVVARDRRIVKYGFAARNQGGSGVTIVEFSA